MKITQLERVRLAPGIYKWSLELNYDTSGYVEMKITADWGRFISSYYGDPVSFTDEEEVYTISGLEAVEVVGYIDGYTSVCHSITLFDTVKNENYFMPIKPADAVFFAGHSIELPVTESGVITYKLK